MYKAPPFLLLFSSLLTKHTFFGDIQKLISGKPMWTLLAPEL
jgi:hypothetical protein